MISIRWYNLYHDTFTSKLKNKDFKFKRFRTKYHYLFSRLEGEVHFLKHFPKTAMIYSYGLGSRTTAVLVHQGSPRFTKDRSVARSCKLRATYPFSSQTKLLLSQKSVYNWSASSFFSKLYILFTFLKMLPLTFVVQDSERLLYFLLWYCDVKMMWLVEPMKIRLSVNSLIKGNRSMN